MSSQTSSNATESRTKKDDHALQQDIPGRAAYSCLHLGEDASERGEYVACTGISITNLFENLDTFVLAKFY
eukprot:5352876-Pyramimonas_sp.AAC.1